MAAEPLVVVAPSLVVPDLFPQLVSDLESMYACPPTLISPRTVSAEGRLSSGRNWKRVTWIFCLTLGPLPRFVGVHPVEMMLRSLVAAPLVTDTVYTPTWLPLTLTGLATLPS